MDVTLRITSEQVAQLRNEIAALHRAIEQYRETDHHNLCDIQQQANRKERLLQIQAELMLLGDRRVLISTELALQRKPVDWAA